MNYDIRPRWRRVLTPHGVTKWMLLSIVWFFVGLIDFIIAANTYGWDARILDHVWLTIAWVVLVGWVAFGTKLYERK